jgi:hypothetical protein
MSRGPQLSRPLSEIAGEDDEGVLLIDGHVHFHAMHPLPALLDAACFHFASHRQRLDGARPSQSCLMLVEPGQTGRFEKLREGTESIGGGWSVEPTDESVSLLLRHPNGSRLSLIAGRQVVTRERLEWLALGCCRPIRDGQDMETTLDAILSHGAFPVLPWGWGKWWGRRGRLVKLLIEKRGDDFALGDNGGRWATGPRPALLQRGRGRGMAVLSGSDPLPLPREQSKVGQVVSAVPGPLSRHEPFQACRCALSLNAHRIETWGRFESLTGALAAQWQLRRAKPAPMQAASKEAG